MSHPAATPPNPLGIPSLDPAASSHLSSDPAASLRSPATSFARIPSSRTPRAPPPYLLRSHRVRARRSSGSSGCGVSVRARANGAASSLPGDAVSMLVLLRRAGEVGSAGLAGHGGGGARELAGQWLEGERDKGRRGKRLQASHRIFWCGQRARGGPVAGESTTAVVGSRGRGRRRWRG